MSKNRLLAALSVAALSVSVAACGEDAAGPDAPLDGDQPLLVGALDSSEIDPAAVAYIVQRVDAFNAASAGAGGSLQLDYPWLFRVGPGTDPFGSLRTGPRWPISSPGYILDASDYTTDIAAGAVDAALVSGFDHWNDIANTGLTAVRQADPGGNFDVIDGTYDVSGSCIDLFDLTSPNLDLVNGFIFPEADIVVGGWAPATYFSQCLGDPGIIGITWTFFSPDSNGDQYLDIGYVEQLYNPAFTWVTSGSMFLDGTSGVDLETIATHEDGHAHGLGHFGGPINRQPFSLKPNGRVFNPEAVMNPFYLFGEKRTPTPTDEAGFRSMYAR